MTLPHEPTEVTKAEVSALLSFGNTQAQVCEYLDITDKTLNKYYGHEIRTAVIRANAQVAKRLFNKAVAQDDLSAQIFWLKTRGRWRTADSERDDEEQTKEQINEIAARVSEINKAKESSY